MPTNIELYTAYLNELSLRGLVGLGQKRPETKVDRTHDDFHKTASANKEYAGFHSGSMKASEFARHGIDNTHRENDPRLKAIHRSIGKNGIREPITMGRGSDGRIKVSDGGHRVTSALQHYRDTGKDVDIPYNYKKS